MRRTTWAVASDEKVDEMLIVQVGWRIIAFTFFLQSVPKTNAPTFGVVLCVCDWFVSYTSICF